MNQNVASAGLLDDRGAPASSSGYRELSFAFTGKAGEYFRIWIVNVLLSIVTLGVYSAWAKVRTKRYFYRNTWLDGSSFEYLGDPVGILKGRIVAVLAFTALFVILRLSMPLYWVYVGSLALLAPWAILQAQAFRAHNSAYRGVRFGLAATHAETFKLYVGVFLINVLTLSLGYPYTQWRTARFFAQHHRFGDEPFVFLSRPKAFFMPFLLGAVLGVPSWVLSAVVSLSASPASAGLAPTLLLFVSVVWLVVPIAFIHASLANARFGALLVGDHSLTCKQRGGELAVIYLTNLAAVLLSLGLLYPWAKIRVAAYRARSMTLYASGEIVATAVPAKGPGAVGDAVMDVGQFDLGFG